MDGFGCVVLSHTVTQFGDDVGLVLVGDGPGKSGNLTGVESTAEQRGIGDGREKPLGTFFELVRNPWGGSYAGHEYTLS